MAFAHWSRLTRVALTASRIAISVGGTGWAQRVQAFDTAASLDVLRRIMVPESTSRATRSILMTRSDLGASAERATPASVAPPARDMTPNRQAVADVPTHEDAKPVTQAKPAIVGFRIDSAFDTTARTVAYNSKGSGET